MKSLLKAVGIRRVLAEQIEAIPLDEAVLCVNCNCITRQTRFGSCPLCGSGCLITIETSILNREETTPCH